MSILERLKGPSGGIVDKAIIIILGEVRTGAIVQQDAKKFAGGLDPKVMGSFIHSSNTTNFQYNDRAMEEILEGFYKEKAFSLKPQETVDVIVKALIETGLSYLAHKIVEACKNGSEEENSASHSQDDQQENTS